MLPREKYAKEAKEAEEKKKDVRLMFEAMVKTQMSTPMGRKFARWVLDLLEYNKPNVHNSAQAYRLAAMQNVAIEIHGELYKIVPAECELMMRERKES